MKVLMPALHYYPVIGGIETWTQNIAERLFGKAEIFVVTGKVKNQPKEENLNGVKIWRTSLFTLSNLSCSPLIYTVSLLPFIFFKSLILIKREKIDVLHCQGFLSSFLGFLLSKLTGVPYIVTVQRIEKRGNPLKEMVYRRAFCRIGASRAVKRYFEAVGAKNIEVIPNGIDLEKYRGLTSLRGRTPVSEFVVITVARLEKVKGIEYLIKAASRLSLPGRFSLLIIGDGSEKKSLENLVKELHLGEKVKFLGQIPNEKIPEHLAAADCFVLPSLREGFGIAILEAQAAGLPVIATKVGGILDIIEDEKTGILVEPENPEAIAKAIFKIYSESDFAHNLVQNAKANLEKYNWDNISQRVLTIYSSILNRNEENEILIQPHDYKNKNDWKRIFNFLDENLDYQEIKDFLDLGAGLGNTAFRILNKNPQCNTVCLDINQNYLDRSKQRHPKIQVILHDVSRRLPLENQSFDLVSCIGVLHSRRIENVEEVLEEMIRVSRRYLLLDFFLEHSPYVFLERIRYPKNTSRRYRARELQALFSKLNLKVIAKIGMRTIFPKTFPFSGKTTFILLEK